MRKITFIISILIISTNLFAKDSTYVSYIEQYKEVAIAQQIKYGIPASITLAQGILESAVGKSKLAVEANNHFGIKCANDWVGLTVTHDDDTKGECFRKYTSAIDSYEDHSLFLKRKRYASLFTLPMSDYKEWAYGLKSCGYATDQKYADKLIRIIEQYDLNALTIDSNLNDSIRQNMTDTNFVSVITSNNDSFEFAESINAYVDHQSKRINGVRYIVANDGDTFASLAVYLNMYEKTLRKYNDAVDNNRELQPGDIVYIYPKKSKANRKTPSYKFNPGDDLWKISQSFGIKLKSIYKINGIAYGTPITTATTLKLR